jgi:hypothetical protein
MKTHSNTYFAEIRSHDRVSEAANGQMSGLPESAELYIFCGYFITHAEAFQEICSFGP